MDDLAAGWFGLADHLRHFGIVVVEHVVKQEDIPFGGTKTFKRRDECGCHVLRELELRFRGRTFGYELVFGDLLERLRTDAVLTLLLELPQTIQAKALRDGDQK